MIFFCMLASAFALWPFETVYESDIASNLLQKLITELGNSEEASTLIREAYMKKHNEITHQSIFGEIEDNSFAEFIKNWKLELYSEILSNDLISKAKSLQNPPLTYEIYKSLTTSYDEATKNAEKNKEEDVQATQCGTGTTLSYRI